MPFILTGCDSGEDSGLEVETMIDGRFTDKLARTSCSPETRPGRSLCLSDLKAQQPYLLRNGDLFCFDDATWNV